MQEHILNESHAGPAGGHLGHEKTFRKVRERFFWPGYSQSVKEWCLTCESCAARKAPIPRRRGPLQNIKTGYPFQLVAVDIMGPFPKTKNGNSYILVASDYFTRWTEAYAMPNQEAVTVATKLVDNMFCRFSVPDQLHSDMGAQFEAQLIKEICRMLHVKKTHTTPYHPQCDGLVERLNRTIQSMLATTVRDQSRTVEWEECLPKVCFAYNTSEHASTGFTPFYLMYGRQARVPLDVMYGLPPGKSETCCQYVSNLRHSLESAYRIARQNSLVSGHRQKEHYDLKIHGKPFTQGDLVWLCNPAVPKGTSRKLYTPWTGPYKIVKCLSELVYRIQDMNRKRKKLVVNFDRLKPYNSRTRSQPKVVTIPDQNTTTTCTRPASTSIQEPPGTNLQIVEDLDDPEDILPQPTANS